MNYLTVSNIIRVVIGLLIFFLLCMLGLSIHEKQAIQEEYSLYRQAVEVQKAKDEQTLKDLRLKQLEELDAVRREHAENLEKHFGELHALQTSYNSAIVNNNRLLGEIRNIDTKWQSYDDTTKQNYARTAANNLAECSATTAELERLAYGYNSEVEYLRSIFPKFDVDGSMIAYDPTTGATRVYHSPIEIKTDWDSIRILPPASPDVDK